jgi:hypothetical protein
MTCNEVLAALTEGTSAPDEPTRKSLAAHSATCEECQHLLAAVSAWEEALAHPDPDDVDPPHVRDAIFAAADRKADELRAKAEASAPRTRVGFLLVAVAIGAAFALGVVVGSHLATPPPSEERPPREGVTLGEHK